ncbi:MAG: indolepyruvate oxidoreductase subunit beta [archaeon GB-1867-005]|nr:indolepyruvate oxidoreductase subunit beta [Candidatus Culexmicrobium cathedralense]
MKTFNLILCGVGGQGLITLGRIIGNAAIIHGTGVSISEVHGMAQRGGSVIVHVRIGEPESPLIPRGMADAMLSLEILEACRNLTYTNNKTAIFVNRRIIRPSIPGIKLPTINEILHNLKKIGLKVEVVDAQKLALKAGAPLSENVVMLGALLSTNILKEYISIEDVEKAILNLFPKRIAEINLKALNLGLNYKHHQTLA